MPLETNATAMYSGGTWNYFCCSGWAVVCVLGYLGLVVVKSCQMFFFVLFLITPY